VNDGTIPLAMRYDIQHNDIQHNDIQHNDIQHNDIQHNDIQHNDIQHNTTQIAALSTKNLSINGTLYRLLC
jgi:hypothetical protein